MNEHDFLQAVAIGHEQVRVEFKGPGDSGDKPFLAKVIKAVLALANTRHGGHVIVGVAEVTGVLTKQGLDAAQLASWTHDQFRARLAPYSDPVPSTQFHSVTSGGLSFAVIAVDEFEEIPIICAKSYSAVDATSGKQVEVLREGAIYVRSLGKVESVSVPSSHEMRILLDLAADKRMKAFLDRARAAGMIQFSTAAISHQDSAYDAEIEDVYVKP